MLLEQRVDRSSRGARVATVAAWVAAGFATAGGLIAQTRPIPIAPFTDSAKSSSAVPKSPGRILGVFDARSSAPLEGAEVVDLFVDAVYRTGTSGLVGLGGFQSRHDSVAVRVRKIGYADTAFVVMVGAADTTPVSVFLYKSVSLPAVITDALANKHLTQNQAEFEGRLHDKSLSGRFLTREDLEKHSDKPLGDVIHDLMAGKSRGCSVPPIMYFDGVRVSPSSLDQYFMKSERADNYEGIEFYTPAAAPLRFGGTSEATSGATGIMAAPKESGPGVIAGAAGPAGSPSSLRAAASCGVLIFWRRESP